MVYDLIVVGMGPAGVSVAIYAKRAGLNVLCIEKSMVGGYLNFIDRIENYPGLFGVSGPDFAFKLFDSIRELNIDWKNEAINEIIDGDVKKVVTSKETYLTRNVILATGRSPRKLNLANEEELYGKGISHCALCDGAFYKDKIVAVVGGGNSALQEALYLANICKEVYLIHRKNDFRVSGQIVDKINQKANITKIMNSSIESLISSDEKLTGIVLNNGMNLDVDGLFIYIGFEPNTSIVNNLKLTDDLGYITVDKNFETKVKGIYAIGDIVKKDIYQIATAVSDGVVAATEIINKIN